MQRICVCHPMRLLSLCTAIAVLIGSIIGHWAVPDSVLHGLVSTAGSAEAATPTAPGRSINQYVAAGALDYVTFGCANCHGPSGRGGVTVPNVSGATTIPALNTPVVRNSLSAAGLTYIIQHGVVLSGKTKVYMPVWGSVMSSRQISDLVTYIKAGMPRFSGIESQQVTTNLGLRVEGQQLYVRYGCVVCHAFNGFGGVPNPSSPDKVISPLRGATFDKQFAKDSDIAYVIKNGSIIGGSPIVSMPVWSSLLSDHQVAALIAYIRSFR